jgi:hypothetical protein
MGATHNSRWYERGMLHPHYDYETPPPHLTRIVDPLTEDGHVEMSDEPGLGEPLDHDYITSNTTQKW